MKHLKLAIALLLALGLIAGAYHYPRNVQQIQVLGSAAGTTFNSAKVASQVVSVSSSTLFAVQNTDGGDRTIIGAEINLFPATTTTAIATTTTHSIQCATSTVATGFTPTNTNWIYQQTIVGSGAEPFGSTTANSGYYIATTSPGITGTSTAGFVGGNGAVANIFARQWKSQSYLVCQDTTSNGSASNLLSSTTQGTISFPYRSQ